MPVQRFECVTPLKSDTGAVDAMSLWAGESVGGVLGLQPAAEIVRELTVNAERLLKQR
jgi:nitronate monooxygenase